MAYAEPVNFTTPIDMFTYANTVTNDLFIPSILLGLFFVIFVATKETFPTEKAFTAASFTTLLVTIMFRWINLTSDFVVFILIISCAVGALWIRFRQRTY